MAGSRILRHIKRWDEGKPAPGGLFQSRHGEEIPVLDPDLRQMIKEDADDFVSNYSKYNNDDDVNELLIWLCNQVVNRIDEAFFASDIVANRDSEDWKKYKYFTSKKFMTTAKFDMCISYLRAVMANTGMTYEIKEVYVAKARKILFKHYSKRIWDEATLLAKNREYDFLLKLEEVTSSQASIDQAVVNSKILADKEDPNISRSLTFARSAFNNDGIYIPQNRQVNLIKEERSTYQGVALYAILGQTKAATELENIEIQSALRESNPARAVALSARSQVVMRFLNKENNEFKLEELLAPSLTPVARQNIVDLKAKYQMEFILQNLYNMYKDYRTLKRSTNTNKIEELIKLIEKLQNSNTKTNSEKVSLALNAISQAFITEKNASRTLFTKRTDQQYIDHINNHPDQYVYPRTLALVLRKTYDQFPNLRARDKTDKVQASERLMMEIQQLPKHKVYEKYIPSLISDKVAYQTYTQKLSGFNFSPIELFRLYCGQDKLVTVARKP